VKVLVDTPIWSYALRTSHKEYQKEIDQLTFLIKEQRVFLIGPIRQELLSGYSDLRKFDGFVKRHFFHFSVIPAEAGIQ